MITIELLTINDQKKLERIQRAITIMDAAGVFDLEVGTVTLHIKPDKQLARVDKFVSFVVPDSI